jgi:hypothetical protein
VGVPRLKEALKAGTQGLGRADTRTAQALAAQERAPNRDLVEPRPLGRYPGESDRGPLGGTPVPHGVLLMRARLVHTQRPAAVGVAGTARAQEVPQFQVGMALRALREDFARADLKSGQELDGARAELLTLLPFDEAWPQGQGWGYPRQGLAGGLLIETEDPPVPGGRQREVKELGPLLRKQGSGAGQEVAPALRVAPQRGQNPWARGGAHGPNLPAPGHPPRQSAHPVRRKAPNLPLRSPWAGDGDDGGARQRGKNPAGDPTGANLGALPRAPLERLLLRPAAGVAQIGPNAGATSAPTSVTSRPGPHWPAWTIPQAPPGEGSRAGLFGAAVSPPAAGLPTLVVRRY